MVAKHLVSASQLIERQHMLIANQNGQIRQHLADLNTTKSEIIRLQGEVIRNAKVERIDIDDEIVDRLSTAVQSSVLPERTVKSPSHQPRILVPALLFQRTLSR